MSWELFQGQPRIRVRALYVGHRIDLRSFEKTNRLAPSPLLVTAGANGAAGLFRYGVVVLFNLTPVEEINFLADLRTFVTDPQDKIEVEEIEVVAAPEQPEGIDQAQLYLQEFSTERLQLVADVLAKSVLLAYYEAGITQSFDRIEPLAANLQRTGKGGNEARDLLRHLGDNLLIQAKMVGRAEVADKPELLWEHPLLERLYARLEDEYEILERNLALERKLDLLSRTAETLLQLLQNKRSLRVEWYIVILIVFEILLTLYEMLF